LQLLGLARAIQQHVVPEHRVEIFERLQFQTLGVDRRLEVAQALIRPDMFIQFDPAPAICCRRGDIGVIVKVVGQVSHDMGCARLPGKTKIILCENVSVEAKSEFHCSWRALPATVRGRGMRLSPFGCLMLPDCPPYTLRRTIAPVAEIETPQPFACLWCYL